MDIQRFRTIRCLAAICLLCVLTILWATESDLAYNIAQQRPVLLGRYTLDKTIGLLIATPILLAISVCLLKSPKTDDLPNHRLFWFKTISATISIVAAIVLVDAALRFQKHSYYVGTATLYHRQPNAKFQGTFVDRPEFAFSYPRKPASFDRVDYTLTIDGRGFRNLQTLEQADWIVLGDSFAEGSKVSDEQTWPFLLANAIGQKVYNLGMSGGNPVTYSQTLKAYGFSLNPKGVLYLLYEGNDFRDIKYSADQIQKPNKPSLRERAFKNSPLRHLTKQAILRLLEPIGAHRFDGDPNIYQPAHRLYPIAWLPFEWPPASGNLYTFDVKRLEQHWITETQFENSPAAKYVSSSLEEIQTLCRQRGIRLVVVYAPDAPHILFEDISASVPSDQIRAFLAVRKKNLPPADKVIEGLKAGVQTKEKIIGQFCQAHQIEFISLTEPLKEKTRQGVKTYYTYDQHWTADGHKVVAEYLADRLSAQISDDTNAPLSQAAH